MNDEPRDDRPREGQDSELYEQRRGPEPGIQSMHAPITREKEEPKDGHEPVPTTWLLVIFAILMWGGWYLGAYSADFDFGVYDGPKAFEPGARVATEGEPEPIDPMLVGKRLYNNCMACHQADGQGLVGQYPPLAGSEWVTGDTRSLSRILLHGLQGEIEVAGESYQGNMPGWSRFDDERIAAVLTYIRNSWGNDAPPVDPETVAGVREKHSGRTQAWTATELRELEEQEADAGETDADGTGEQAVPEQA